MRDEWLRAQTKRLRVPENNERRIKQNEFNKRPRAIQIFAGFGGGSLWPSGEPERFSRARLGVLSRSSRKSLKRTKLKNSFRHAVQECQNRDPEKMFSQATWKRLSLDVPSRRYPERRTMTKAGERKEENFLIESLVKEMKREKFFPFSDQSAYRECGGAGNGRRKKSRQIEFRWNVAYFSLCSISPHTQLPVTTISARFEVWEKLNERSWDEISSRERIFICFLNQIISAKVFHAPLLKTRLENISGSRSWDFE